MGLDMFLNKRKKMQNSNEYDEELIYWRKANQIRNWFVNNIEEFEYTDNCQQYIVTKQLIENLIEDCNTVLKEKNNIKIAKQILPTSSGFFFGDTTYDDMYYDDLEETIKKLTPILETINWDEEEVYYTEWW